MTRQQALTLRYLQWYIWRFGYAPTRRELAEAMGVGATSMHKRLKVLEKKGFVRLESSWRGIVLAQSPLK